MLSQAMYAVADYKRVAQLGVAELVHAKVISGANELAVAAVPKDKSKIAQQIFQAAITPDSISM